MTSPLPAAASGPGKDARLVQAMFDQVAPRYDLANTVLSAGQDRHWRRVAVAAVRPQPGQVVLDVAAGTGALAAELRRSGSKVVALDFSVPMLAAGAAREHRRAAVATLWWTAGDALRLPFADRSIDAVTIAFGLRNLPDPRAALAEFARVTRPGGRLAVLEFSHPTWTPWRAVYTRYLVTALPRIAAIVSSHGAAYRYLAESILAWPDQDELAGWLAAAGWRDVRYANLSGGIVACHRGRLPG